MTMKRAFVVIVVAFVSAHSGASADDRLAISHPLTEDQIEAALAVGNDVEADVPSLTLGSPGVNWGGTASDSNRTGHFFEQSVNRRGRTSGFGVELFTPYAWIAHLARDSLDKGRPMDIRHVHGNDQLREPVLRILCHSDVPEELVDGAYGRQVASVSIRPTNEKLEKLASPVMETRIAERYRTPDGDSVDVGPLLATFTLDDVLEISSLDKKGEFYVVIVADDGEEKDFKVKTKHFDSLP